MVGEDAPARNSISFAGPSKIAIKAGARRSTPRHGGYSTPTEYEALFRTVRERVPNPTGRSSRVHCHDDLGLAVANSWPACGGAPGRSSARSWNSERAGNAALEEFVMADAHPPRRPDRSIQASTPIIADAGVKARLGRDLLPGPIQQAIVGGRLCSTRAAFTRTECPKMRIPMRS